MDWSTTGKFEEHINELYSPQNVNKTAKKFKEYEKKNGPYASGNSRNSWCRRRKTGSTNPDQPRGHDKWEKHSGAIPKAIRDKITEVIATNLKVAQPDAAGAEGRRERRRHA